MGQGCLPPKVRDMVGERHGMLEVLEYTGLLKNRAYWLCKCDCGRQDIFRGDHLRYGNTKSCGCERDKNQIKPTHGMSTTNEFRIWAMMLNRCNSPADKGYYNYGGRGIKVCERWHKFENFYEDMGPRPGKEYSLDRIENDGDYEPGNVKWATDKEQCRNKRTNKLLTFNGETHCLTEWAEIVGMTPNTLQLRLFYGWSVEKALTTPPGKSRARKRVKEEV